MGMCIVLMLRSVIENSSSLAWDSSIHTSTEQKCTGCSLDSYFLCCSRQRNSFCWRPTLFVHNRIFIFCPRSCVYILRRNFFSAWKKTAAAFLTWFLVNFAVFQHNIQYIPSIKWQYFISTDGIHNEFPAHNFQNVPYSNCRSVQDQRHRYGGADTSKLPVPRQKMLLLGL